MSKAGADDGSIPVLCSVCIL